MRSGRSAVCSLVASELRAAELQQAIDDVAVAALERGVRVHCAGKDDAQELIARHLADEAGVHVFAASVPGLFLAIADHTLSDPEVADPVQGSESGVQVLRAGLASTPGAGEPLNAPSGRLVVAVGGGSPRRELLGQPARTRPPMLCRPPAQRRSRPGA